MSKIDFTKPPYDHSGRWEKKYKSIFDPHADISWPEFIGEAIIWWRAKLIRDFPAITKGKGWSKAISGQVRRLMQQVYVIVSFFPHPDDEPLVHVAVKNYLRKNRVTTVGSYRKHRVKVGKNGKQSLTITQAEKDVINGIASELNNLLKKRDDLFDKAKEAMPEEVKESPTFARRTKSKKSIKSLIELERKVLDSK